MPRSALELEVVQCEVQGLVTGMEIVVVVLEATQVAKVEEVSSAPEVALLVALAWVALVVLPSSAPLWVAPRACRPPNH